MERNPFPEIKLFRPVIHLKRLGEFLLGIHDVPLRESDHYDRSHFYPDENTGAAPMLDRALDEPVRTIPDIQGRDILPHVRDL